MRFSTAAVLAACAMLMAMSLLPTPDNQVEAGTQGDPALPASISGGSSASKYSYDEDDYGRPGRHARGGRAGSKTRRGKEQEWEQRLPSSDKTRVPSPLRPGAHQQQGKMQLDKARDTANVPSARTLPARVDLGQSS